MAPPLLIWSLELVIYIYESQDKFHGFSKSFVENSNPLVIMEHLSSSTDVISPGGPMHRRSS
jgi:hypothetical protein